MPRPRPLHLHKQTTRHGKTVWYVRIGQGPRTRLRADYGTPEFEAEYQAAISAKPAVLPGKAAKGSLQWLWDLYRQAGAWTDLAGTTRARRDNIMKPVLETSGKEPVSKVTRLAVEKGIDRRKATPSQAKLFLDALGGMFKWAVPNELAKFNPTADLGVKSKNTGGWKIWTDEEMAKYEKRWPRGTRERVAFDVYQYTGLRRGDAAALGKQHIKNGVISIQLEKTKNNTGVWVHLPVHPELQKTIEAGPTGDLAIISRLDGSHLNKRYLGNLFGKACRSAGVKKSAHGIRKWRASDLADRGEATDNELDAFFGWTGGTTSKIYTRGANRKKLAANVNRKLMATEREQSIPSPSQADPSPLKISNEIK